MKAGDRPFVVGRRTRKGTTVVLIRRDEAPEPDQPIPGPWTLHAVVSPAS